MEISKWQQMAMLLVGDKGKVNKYRARMPKTYTIKQAI
jgi:hypothetical protein